MFLHTFLIKFVYHMLVEFEQTCMVQTTRHETFANRQIKKISCGGMVLSRPRIVTFHEVLDISVFHTNATCLPVSIDKVVRSVKHTHYQRKCL